MKIDLHIHSRDCSDGRMSVADIFAEAVRRNIGLMSITDHDAVECQESIQAMACSLGIRYITGVELNIAFSPPEYGAGKGVSLDLLGYGYDAEDRALNNKLRELRAYRKVRAEQILEKVNREIARNGKRPLTREDMAAIEESADGGALGRPHIADHMVKKGLVAGRQEAFDKYLVACNVPKMPVGLKEASELVRAAGGKVVLAHPNDPNGTSLAKLTPSLEAQQGIIRRCMLPYLDGIECWHSRHDPASSSAYAAFAKAEGLLMTGGSDCHQRPLRIGTVRVPDFVAEQFSPLSPVPGAGQALTPPGRGCS